MPALGSQSKVGRKGEGMAEPEAVTAHPYPRERLQLLPGLGLTLRSDSRLIFVVLRMEIHPPSCLEAKTLWVLGTGRKRQECWSFFAGADDVPKPVWDVPVLSERE